jgi:DNA mismatch endonuclease (patch repair protein)
MDKISTEARSRNMAAVKACDTKPELILRTFLHSWGYRYSLHRNNLPGKPDIFLRKYATVIFVHGCFWHQHKGCKDSGMPKTNRSFWLTKLRSNIERDKVNIKKLKKLGYKVIVIWECEISKKLCHKLERRIKKLLV